jgi:hypothetical protein
MNEKCPKCGTKMKETSPEIFGTKGILTITYCPKCEYCECVMPPLSFFRGKALRGIDKRTGEFRLRVASPKEWSKKEIMVRTFPSYIGERRAKVYPELKRGDEVIVVGFMTEGIPLLCVVMNNLKIGISSKFVADQIKLKKGFLKSFSIRNPILVEAEKVIEKQ